MAAMRRLSRGYAGITATVALVLALGMGGAYAASKISSKDVAKGAVKSKHIKDGGVRTNDLAPDVEVPAARTANAANNAKTADTAKAVAPNAVTGASIADGTVGTADLAGDSVTAPKVADNAITMAELASASVGSDEIVSGSVGKAHLGQSSVGTDELASQTAVRGEGVNVPAGQARDTSVTCPPGTQLLAGGYAWTYDTTTSIVASAPHELYTNTRWVVRGFVPSGAPANNLYAWATCLDA